MKMLYTRLHVYLFWTYYFLCTNFGILISFINKIFFFSFELLVTSLQNNKIFRPVQIESICSWQNKGTETLKFVKGRVENIVGKGENAGYQHFVFFPLCFHKAFLRVIESRNCVGKELILKKGHFLYGNAVLKATAIDCLPLP